MAEETGEKFIPLFCAAHAGQHDAWPALFHADIGEINIQCACGEETLLGEGELFGGHVVDVAGKLQNILRLGLGFTEQHADHIGSREILKAGAVSDPGNPHGRHAAKSSDKVLQQRSPGGGAELSENISRVNGDAFQQLLGRRSGNRQHTVGAADRSAADVNRRGNDLIGRQFIHQVTD